MYVLNQILIKLEDAQMQEVNEDDDEKMEDEEEKD